MELSMLVSLEPRTKEKTNKKSEKKTIKNKKTSNRSKKKNFYLHHNTFYKDLDNIF